FPSPRTSVNLGLGAVSTAVGCDPPIPDAAGLTSAVLYTYATFSPATPAVCAADVFSLVLPLFPHAATPLTDTRATIPTTNLLMTTLRICNAMPDCIAICDESTVLPKGVDGFGGKS